MYNNFKLVNISTIPISHNLSNTYDFSELKTRNKLVEIDSEEITNHINKINLIIKETKSKQNILINIKNSFNKYFCCFN